MRNCFLSKLNKLDNKFKQDATEFKVFLFVYVKAVISHLHGNQREEVVGFDSSKEAAAEASKNYPELSLEKGSAYDDLATLNGIFLQVLSLEDLDCAYASGDYPKSPLQIVQCFGNLNISILFQSCLKNLVMVLKGMYKPFIALGESWAKNFCSPKIFKKLAAHAFEHIDFYRVERMSPFA